jgi:outer membrane protein insertion porin family
MKFLLSVILLFALAVSALAQKKEERHFPLVQVNVSGSQRYSPAAIISALGFRIGQQATQDQLQAGSQTLANSGLFSVVQFRFGWAGNGVVANYELTDSPQLVPVGFENFVWFTPNELATAIKKNLPLFTGVVPLAGTFRDEVTSALQKILKEKSINGQVTSIPHGALNGPIEAMLFRVDGHPIKVTNTDFPGADHADKLSLTEIGKYVGNTNYEKSIAEGYIHSRLQDIYENIGFLNAHFAPPQVKVLSSAPDHTEIALTTNVNEGAEYKFAGVTWTGNTVLPANELTDALKFEPGQTASVPKFRERLAAIRQLYGKYGYIGLKMNFSPTLAANNTATFNVKLREGTQYRLGTVEFKGVDQLTQGRVLSSWKLKSGEIYDDNYPSVYMSTEFGNFVPAKFEWEWRNREVIHDDTNIVDLLIEVEFKPRKAY